MSLNEKSASKVNLTTPSLGKNTVWGKNVVIIKKFILKKKRSFFFVAGDFWRSLAFFKLVYDLYWWKDRVRLPKYADRVISIKPLRGREGMNIHS